MSDVREFPNSYPDYDDTTPIFDAVTGKLKEEIEGLLLENTFALLHTLEKRLSTEVDWNDTSVYTGTSGIALMYLHFLDVRPCEGKKDFLKDALSYVEPVLAHLKKKRFSFMCGVPGPLALGAVLFHRAGFSNESKNLSRRLENLERDACVGSGDLPDELLYGRVGYLFAILFMMNHIGKDELQENIVKQVVASVLKSGQRLSKKFKNSQNLPLYYEWHDKAYVGSAHGFAGILYMLLQAKDYMTSEQLTHLVKPCIDFVATLQFPSGNFPSSLGNNSDRLVHWCHGAPGVVHLLVLASEIFSDSKYLDAAKLCSDVIWKRGLLIKGYGICHGVAGNGYAHLRLFQVTKEDKYLYRALKFGEWCYEYGKHGCHVPDHQLSLFEGMAGTIYFLSDLLDPLNSAFPAFQLNDRPTSEIKEEKASEETEVEVEAEAEAPSPGSSPE